MDTHQINPSVIELAREFKEALEADNYDIREFFVFGSQVKGTATPSSDIDVLIVSPNVTGCRPDDYPKLRRISRPISIDLEPHAFPPEEFVDENSLVYEVKRTGIKL
jgi:predicted nucleotidyltransferase